MNYQKVVQYGVISIVLFTAQTHAATCGNGILEGTEMCDYGPGNNNDGCNDSCQITLEPFTCNSNFYQVLNNQFVIVDVVNETYEIISQHTHNLNSLGYNIQDNLIYANQGGKLVIIGSGGKFLPMGNISGFASNYVGEFDNKGNRYTAKKTDVRKIDVNQRPLEATKVTTNFQGGEKIYGADMSFDSELNAFIIHNGNGNTYAFHHQSGTISLLGGPTVTKTFGATWYDQEEQILYGGYNGKSSKNISGAIYYINFLSGEYHHIMDMPIVAGNDATNCAAGGDPFESNTTKCQDGIDNDGDGIIDCNDSSCFDISVCFECGNGRVEGDEQCDDGNQINGDSCDNQCKNNVTTNGCIGGGHTTSFNTGESKVCITQGEISLEPICNIDFGTIKMSSTDQVVQGKLDCPIIVHDLKGSDQGRTVTIAADNLIGQDDILGDIEIHSTKISIQQETGEALVMSGHIINHGVEKTELTYKKNDFGQGKTYSLLHRNGERSIQQIGTFYSEPVFQIIVPAHTPASTYNGSITVTLTEGM